MALKPLQQMCSSHPPREIDSCESPGFYGMSFSGINQFGLMIVFVKDLSILKDL